MATYRHLAGLTATAEFSKDGKHRYWLQMAHSSGRPGTVCAVMLNPSYASETVADKSVQFLERLVFEKDYAEFRGVGRLIVVNLFSYIQTKDFEGGADKHDRETDRYIRRGIEEADITLLAWGRAAPYPDRIETVKSMVRELGKTEVYVAAKHPSRGFYENFISRAEEI